jgi:hypothetical protein
MNPRKLDARIACLRRRARTLHWRATLGANARTGSARTNTHTRAALCTGKNVHPPQHWVGRIQNPNELEEENNLEHNPLMRDSRASALERGHARERTGEQKRTAHAGTHTHKLTRA